MTQRCPRSLGSAKTPEAWAFLTARVLWGITGPQKGLGSAQRRPQAWTERSGTARSVQHLTGSHQALLTLASCSPGAPPVSANQAPFQMLVPECSCRVPPHKKKPLNLHFQIIS